MAFLERTVLGLLLAATLATPLFVAQSGLARTETAVTFGLLFWQWFLALYALVGLPVAAVARGFGKALRRPVSDHGFEVIEGRRGSRPDPGQAPDGVFLAAGPAFRPGRVDGLGVLDIMPLLLDLKGFALARDMKGRLPEAALTQSWLARERPPKIESYDLLRRGQVARSLDDPRLDQAEIEELRALGYIK
jgi:hypothetical protein